MWPERCSPIRRSKTETLHLLPRKRCRSISFTVSERPCRSAPFVGDSSRGALYSAKHFQTAQVYKHRSSCKSECKIKGAEPCFQVLEERTKGALRILLTVRFSADLIRNIRRLKSMIFPLFRIYFFVKLCHPII